MVGGCRYYSQDSWEYVGVNLEGGTTTKSFPEEGERPLNLPGGE